MAKGDKVEQLERAILELGTEIFRLKTELSAVKGHQENFIEVMKGLKQILDEKGLINVEDFDSAVDLGKALALTASSSLDFPLDEEMEKIKKICH